MHHFSSFPFPSSDHSHTPFPQCRLKLRKQESNAGKVHEREKDFRLEPPTAPDHANNSNGKKSTIERKRVFGGFDVSGLGTVVDLTLSDCVESLANGNRDQNRLKRRECNKRKLKMSGKYPQDVCRCRGIHMMPVSISVFTDGVRGSSTRFGSGAKSSARLNAPPATP